MKYSVTSPRNSFTTIYAGSRWAALLLVAADIEPTKRGLIRTMRKETEGRASINRPHRITITTLNANTTAHNRTIRPGKDSRRTTISIRVVNVIRTNGKSSLRTKHRHLITESRSSDSRPLRAASSQKLVKRAVNSTRVQTSTVLNSEWASMV